MTLYEIARDTYRGRVATAKPVRPSISVGVVTALGLFLAVLVTRARSLRREALTVGGLGLMVAGAWTYSLDGRGALGYVATGAALWLLEWLTTPTASDDMDGSA